MFRKAMSVSLVVVLFAGASSALGDRVLPLGSGESVAIPSGSPVQLSSIDRDSLTAKFSGRFLLTGEAFYENQGNDNPPDVYIVPDASLVSRLPHWKARSEPTQISLTNPRSFLGAAIPALPRSEMRKEGVSVPLGAVSIWADRYSMTIECDSPAYYARFLSVYRPTIRVAKAFNGGGCL